MHASIFGIISPPSPGASPHEIIVKLTRYIQCITLFIYQRRNISIP